MMLAGYRTVVLALGLACCMLSACGGAVDLTQTVEVADFSSGWFDAGIVDGKNKLVPSVTFKLRKKGEASFSSVSLNVVFKPVGGGERFDEVYVQSVDFGGPQTEPITVLATVGYTGDPPQTRAEMLKNTYFKDMETEIFAKAGSAQWTAVHGAPIVRQLLTK